MRDQNAQPEGYGRPTGRVSFRRGFFGSRHKDEEFRPEQELPIRHLFRQNITSRPKLSPACASSLRSIPIATSAMRAIRRSRLSTYSAVIPCFYYLLYYFFNKYVVVVGPVDMWTSDLSTSYPHIVENFRPQVFTRILDRKRGQSLPVQTGYARCPSIHSHVVRRAYRQRKLWTCAHLCTGSFFVFCDGDKKGSNPPVFAQVTGRYGLPSRLNISFLYASTPG